MSEKLANQRFVTWTSRPYKYSPLAMEDEMPLPFRIVTSNRRHYDIETDFYACIRSVAVRYFLA